MEVIPQAGALGAEIRGVDLSGHLTDAEVAQINQAFLDHQVIFFRDQVISNKEYLRFVEYFGPPMEYVFDAGLPDYPFITPIVKTETSTESFGSYWHSDSTYRDIPPKATFLYAREIPNRGGDTLFADMYAAYEHLSQGMKDMLDGLDAVYSAGLFDRKEDTYEGMRGINEGMKAMSAVHPVIRTHDETGRKSLYVNETHTFGFDGMSRDESLAILEYIYEHVKRPEFSFRLRWEKDTLTIWDNRCTQHYALDDYPGKRRVMHRVIVEGSRPR